jgi:hypothetical protein
MCFFLPQVLTTAVFLIRGLTCGIVLRRKKGSTELGKKCYQVKQAG